MYTKNKYITTFLIFFLIASFSDVISQHSNIKFDHYTVKDGLSQSTVICIVQDKQGFMWFGTLDGLNRFDGYNFKIYKFDPNDPYSIGRNSIRCILEDSQGNLWIGTEGGGLNLYDRANDRFIRYLNDPSDPHSLRDNSVASLYEDSKNNLWIGTFGGGLNRFDLTTQKFENYLIGSGSQNSRNIYSIMSICEDKVGRLWLGSWGSGLHLFDIDSKKYIANKQRYKIIDLLEGIRIWKLIIDRNNNLWITTDQIGAFKYNIDTEQYENYFTDKNDPRVKSQIIPYVFEDKKGTIWIGSDGSGLVRKKSSNNDFDYYKHNPVDRHSISHNVIRSIYEDNTGVLWIGALHGLNWVDINNLSISSYVKTPNNKNSLSNNEIRALYQDEYGILWIGTDGGGLNSLDISNNLYNHYGYDVTNQYSIGDDKVLKIFEDSEGILWFGTYTGGLNYFDRKTEKFGKFVNNPSDSLSISSNFIRDIYEDKSGELWIATVGGGLNKFNKKTKIFIRYQPDPQNSNSISNNSTLSVLEDSQGFIWVGTLGGGVNRFNPKSEKFKVFLYGEDREKSISGNFVYKIFEDSKNNLWFGTENGLDKYDIQNETFKNYSEKDGLINNVIYGILEDENQNLWLSTNKGISKFNPELEFFNNFDISNGLQNDEFSISAYTKGIDGKLYFGGYNGFESFYPDSLMKNSSPPSIVITNLTVLQNEIDIYQENDNTISRSINEAKEITLSYKDKIISLEFSALHYAYPAKNEYAYIMEGLEDKWNYVKTRRFVTYTNLPSGEYTFKVKGTNNAGVWNEEGAQLKIIITPPFWETLWFRLILALVILSIFVSIIYYRTKQIKIRANKLEKLVKERTIELQNLNHTKDKVFSIISHDLRSPFNHILGSSKILSSNVDSLSQEEIRELSHGINTSNKKLFVLLENLLEWSRIQMGGIKNNSERILLNEIINESINLLSGTASDKSISISNDCKEKLYLLCDKNMLKSVLRNTISNSIKFSQRDQSITLNADQKNGKVNIYITDQGVGMSSEEIKSLFKMETHFSKEGTQNEKGTGLGLIICKEFVEMNNGELQISSSENNGTTIKITFPSA